MKADRNAREKRMMRRRLVNAYASSIVSISLVLMLIGLASLLIVNARNVSDYFKENLQVLVMMRENVPEAKAAAYRDEVASLPYVRSARVVSREEGTEELKSLLGEDFLDVFESSPVPVSLDVTLYAPYVNPDSLAMITSLLSESPLVDEVECRQNLVDVLNQNLTRISLLLAVFIALLLFISFVLIGNTVRLNVFSRRFTVHTMKLVGATRAFIRKPFLKGAVLQGLISALIALTGTGAAVFFARRSFPQLLEVVTRDSMIMVACIVVAAGVFICVVSTWMVVNRLVALNKDDLYY